MRFLVESALRSVMSDKDNARPSNRQEWVTYLAESLMSESDAPYQSVLTSLMANGVSSEEIFQRYVPEAARYLGELWVSDKASFVDVTVGAARLQQLFRECGSFNTSDWIGRSIPLGHSVLMVIPKHEDHALGAFVAADDLRRHGLWVHMAISLEDEELVALIAANRFSMIGISAGGATVLQQTADLVAYIRNKVEHLPPIIVGGNVLDKEEDVVERLGADFAARSAAEAIELCNLPTVSEVLGFEKVS